MVLVFSFRKRKTEAYSERFGIRVYFQTGHPKGMYFREACSVVPGQQRLHCRIMIDLPVRLCMSWKRLWISRLNLILLRFIFMKRGYRSMSQAMGKGLRRLTQLLTVTRAFILPETHTGVLV